MDFRPRLATYKLCEVGQVFLLPILLPFQFPVFGRALLPQYRLKMPILTFPAFFAPNTWTCDSIQWIQWDLRESLPRDLSDAREEILLFFVSNCTYMVMPVWQLSCNYDRQGWERSKYAKDNTVERWKDPESLMIFVNQCTSFGPSLPPVICHLSVICYKRQQLSLLLHSF